MDLGAKLVDSENHQDIAYAIKEVTENYSKYSNECFEKSTVYDDSTFADSWNKIL